MDPDHPHPKGRDAVRTPETGDLFAPRHDLTPVAALAKQLADAIAALPLDERIEALNAARTALHAVSPFQNEPIDLVLWVPADSVTANDYNPNAVAPPEMKLLERSIDADGYTQPLVTSPTDAAREIVDGFHRNRVGREVARIRERVHGRLPIVSIRASQGGRVDRIAATIRHNRARGVHGVDPMVEIVGELAACGMGDDWIAKNIGMDADEVLRLKQVSGIAALFKDREFSQAWAANEGDVAFYGAPR